MKPQTKLVLDLLREAGEDGLTQIECLKAGGGMRLSGRILELRQEGFSIITTWESSRGATFARYILEEAEPTLGLVPA